MLFTWIGTTWGVPRGLSDVGVRTGDAFGQSVSIGGDSFIVIGSPRADALASNLSEDQGAAYIYRKTESEWPLVSRETWGAQPGDWTGTSVACFNGTSAAVGAPGRDLPGKPNAGIVRTFSALKSSVYSLGSLSSPDPQVGGNFGWALAAGVDPAGLMLVVGAPGQTVQGLNSGAAYVFIRLDGTWSLQATLLHPNPVTSGLFGHSVALLGNWVAIGAPQTTAAGATTPGSVCVFKRSGSTWALDAVLSPSDTTPGPGFGRSVLIRDNPLFFVVGAHAQANWMNETPSGGSAGAVYFFAKLSNVWTQTSKLIGDGGTRDNFGWCLGYAHAKTLIGAPWMDLPSKPLSGALYVH